MISGIRFLRRNLISNVIGVVVPAIAWLIVVPVLVHSLGEQAYGIYIIALSFAGVLRFLELGLTSAATKYIAEVDTRGNPEKLELIISSNLAIYIGLGGCITLLCLIFAPEIALLLFNDTELSVNELALIVRLIGVLLALILLRDALSAVPRGFQRYDIYNGIQIFYGLALVLIQLVIVLRGGHVVELMQGHIIITLVSLVCFVLAIRYLIPGIRLLRFPDGALLRVMFTFGIYMMIINLGATLLHNLDKVMVGWVVGSEGVAYYSVPTQIAFKVHTGIALIVSFLFPLSSEVQSMGDLSTLRKIFLQSMRLIMLIDGLVMVFLGTFANQILSIWIDPSFALSSAPILVFTSIGYFIFALSIIPFNMLVGMGYPRQMAVMNTLAAICVVLGLMVGLSVSGLIGGSIGVVVGMSAMITLPWYLQRRLDISWAMAFRHSYGKTFICTISGILISLALPQDFLVKFIYFIGFSITLLVFGNTRREDWVKFKAFFRKSFHTLQYCLIDQVKDSNRQIRNFNE